MRPFASILLSVFALTAGAAEVWRWKDANGTWHYQDSPAPGAERVDVQSTPRSSSPATPVPAYVPSPPPQPVVRYTRCAVIQPENDAVFQATDAVTAGLAIEPALQPGHRVEVFLNGSLFPDWPQGTFFYSFQGLFRGSYALAVRVVDDAGRTQCTGPAITFHIRQPSVLSPLRRPAAGN